MSNQDLRMEVVDILRSVEPDLEPETLDRDTSLGGELGLTDSDKRSIAGQVNQRFDLAISEQECTEIDTVGALIDYIESHIE